MGRMAFYTGDETMLISGLVSDFTIEGKAAAGVVAPLISPSLL